MCRRGMGARRGPRARREGEDSHPNRASGRCAGREPRHRGAGRRRDGAAPPALPAANLDPVPRPAGGGAAVSGEPQTGLARTVPAASAPVAPAVQIAKQLDEHEGLATAVFARCVPGLPRVSVNGVERDLAPAELAAVLDAYSKTRTGADLRLVVVDVVRPDDAAWQVWARWAGAASGRTGFFAVVGTPRARPGGRAAPPCRLRSTGSARLPPDTVLARSPERERSRRRGGF